MSGTELLQAIVDGILTGGVYALMAAGLTLIFGVMDIINIAQGVMVILGAYLSYELSAHVASGCCPVCSSRSRRCFFWVSRWSTSSCAVCARANEPRCRSSSRTQS